MTAPKTRVPLEDRRGRNGRMLIDVLDVVQCRLMFLGHAAAILEDYPNGDQIQNGFSEILLDTAEMLEPFTPSSPKGGAR